MAPYTPRTPRASVAAKATMAGKMRWGDSADIDDDDEEFEVALPASQVREGEKSWGNE